MSEIAKSILKGAKEALEYSKEKKAKGYRVHIPEEIDVKRIRQKLHLNQREFAQQFGLEFNTVKNWEQHRRTPEGPARVLLCLIDKIPYDVQKALSHTQTYGFQEEERSTTSRQSHKHK
jgi:putative transcriptional regulator